MLTTGEKKARAVSFNGLGLIYYRDKLFEQALEYFTEARISPDSPIYAQNATDAYIATGRYRAALDDLRQALGLAKPSAALQARLAFLLSQTGAVDDALKTYRSLFQGGLRDDNSFSLYANLLSHSKQHEAVISETNKYLEQHDSVPVRVLLANLYRQAGQADKAIDTLREQQQKYPEDRSLGLALAQTYDETGRYAEAVRLCAQLCERGPATASAYYLKAQGEYGLKRFREAKASLEAALKAEPANASIKTFLDRVSGMLGQGSNTSLKNVIDPVPFPSSLLLTSSNAVPKPFSSYGGYFTHLIKAIQYVPGKEFTTTESRAIKVLDEAGVTKFSSFEVPFDPLGEELFVNDLTVRDAGGAVLSTGTVDDYYVMDDTSRGEASQDKVVHIPVSGLRPGCEISLTITRPGLRETGRISPSRATDSPKPFPCCAASFSCARRKARPRWKRRAM